MRSLAKRVGHYLKATIDHTVSESDRAIKVGDEDLGIFVEVFWERHCASDEITKTARSVKSRVIYAMQRSHVYEREIGKKEQETCRQQIRRL